MSFQHKLDTVMKKTGITNAALSRASLLDASLISRFRTGVRTPHLHSKQLHSLCQGIMILTVNESNRENIIKVCNLSPSLKGDALYNAIYQWFSATDSMLKSVQKSDESNEFHKKTRRNNSTLKAFNEKLDILMNSLGVSNIRLARFLNVDASLISRFRTGIRTPSVDSQLILDICTYFSSRTKTQQQATALLDILDLSLDTNSLYTPKLLYEHLYQWLNEKQENADYTVMDNFLEKLDSFQLNWNIPPVLPESIPFKEGELQVSESYWGTEGIQQAVIRLLKLTAEQTTPRTLCLYSNQSMNWLTKSTDFTKIWASLMFAVLSKKNKIQIIHHVDRNLSEMLTAIEKWLPLYMTGLIEPYYCKKPNNSCFTRTMFIATNLAYVNSDSVLGTQNPEYIFSTTSQQVTYLTKQFQTLLDYCDPLMQIFTPLTSEQYLLRFAEFERKEGNVKTLLPSLSLCTLPESLLVNIIDRYALPLEERKKILLYHENRIKQFYRTLQNSSKTEFFAFPTEEQINNGTIRIDIPKFILNTPLYYTPEEYAKHIENIVQNLSQLKGYRFYPIPVSPFKNLQIIIKKEVGAIVVKGDNPAAAFIFKHPLLCSALESYLDSMYNKDTSFIP